MAGDGGGGGGGASPSLDDLRMPTAIAAAVRKTLEGLGVELQAAAEDGAAAAAAAAAPRAPILVFINSRSGGRLGPELLACLSKLVRPEQVYELSKAKPNVVLPGVVDCLDVMAHDGDQQAKDVRRNLRILVAGGDGTVGWLLSVIDLLHTEAPPIGVIPLGTGNDLSRSYGWGPTFSSATVDSVSKRLLEAAAAAPHNLDGWNIKVVPSPDLDASQIQMPYALHKGPPDSDAPEGQKDYFVGSFYNYFSIGMDAEVTHAFHDLRNRKPWLARGPTANKTIYSVYGCTQGWFCLACSAQPQARCVNVATNMLIQKEAGGQWLDLAIPNSVRAVVVLNLQSYAGGRDPWGEPTAEENEKNGWLTARPDDGRLEIIGFTGGWHSLKVLSFMGDGLRLAQAYGVRCEFRGEHKRAVYLQLDGEPWAQPLSSDSREPTVVELTRKPKPSVMLLNGDIRRGGPHQY